MMFIRQSLISNKASTMNHKKSFFYLLSLFNGILYYAIAMTGSSNIDRIFNLHHSTHWITYLICTGASLVYTMFTYQTLISFSCQPSNLIDTLLMVLSLLSASAFFTAGYQGAAMLGFNSSLALPIAFLLFGLRLINCVDASAKFTKRVKLVYQDWCHACSHADYTQQLRICIVILVSIGYTASATDAIFHAMFLLGRWTQATSHAWYNISFVCSVLGAIATFPLIFYWTHRGLEELTTITKIKHRMVTQITDRYTYLGAICVAPVILGIIGSVTMAHSAIFGSLGLSANLTRVITSIVYALCAGTPGIAAALRSFAKGKKIDSTTTSTN